MARHVVATVDEIPPGGRKIVELEGRSFGIFNLAGEFYAIRNACPHEGGPLCQGVITGFVTSDAPGRYEYVRRGEVVRCPWHGWEFDIKTGQSWLDPKRIHVKHYPVFVEEVGPSAAAAATAADLREVGLTEGPYRAEVYPVTVDEVRRLVIVEL